MQLAFELNTAFFLAQPYPWALIVKQRRVLTAYSMQVIAFGNNMAGTGMFIKFSFCIPPFYAANPDRRQGKTDTCLDVRIKN